MLALAFALLLAAPSVSAEDEPDPDLDEVLGGFEEDDGESDSEAGDELDDVLGGFEEEEGAPAERRSSGSDERIWDLTGSAAIGASVPYLQHDAADGRDYRGLMRLRTRLNAQLDVELPKDWKLRVAGYGFYDWAYLINGRDSFTTEVLDQYEWEADVSEVWLQGSLSENLDVKIGRQVVNWGRSDTLQVLDVLNPVDNREPGLADLEDLRRTVMMVKIDYYWKNWSFSAIAQPEMRFNKDPVFGNDFAPDVGLGQGLANLAAGALGVIPRVIPDESLKNTVWGGSITGIFEGWDVSLHLARYWDRTQHLDWDLSPILAFLPLPPPGLPDPQLEFSRLWLVGAGGNYTVGSWLFKSEVAWRDAVDYSVADRVAIPGLGQVEIPVGTVDKNRLDTMAGVEYYGFTDITVALEMVNRHIFDFDRRMTRFEVDENALETALRITGTFLNERLETTALGIAFGDHAQDGAVLRLQASYDIRDALVFTAGILLFKEGDPPPFDSIGRNDRFFFELKYSF